MQDNEKSEKPLPRPPKTPFGGNRWSFGAEDTTDPSLLADKLAMAVAEGKLEDFLNSQLPDSEQARALAMMMLSMSGMADFGASRISKPEEQTNKIHNNLDRDSNIEDLCQAVQSGDMRIVKEMLKEEHQRRSAISEMSSKEIQDSLSPIQPTVQEKELIDKLIAIASDNNTTVDWLIMRALRIYIQDYERTGRL